MLGGSIAMDNKARSNEDWQWVDVQTAVLDCDEGLWICRCCLPWSQLQREGVICWVGGVPMYATEAGSNSSLEHCFPFPGSPSHPSDSKCNIVGSG